MPSTLPNDGAACSIRSTTVELWRSCIPRSDRVPMVSFASHATTAPPRIVPMVCPSIHVLVVLRLPPRSEEHTSELQSRGHLVCRLLLAKEQLTCSSPGIHPSTPVPWANTSPPLRPCRRSPTATDALSLHDALPIFPRSDRVPMVSFASHATTAPPRIVPMVCPSIHVLVVLRLPPLGLATRIVRVPR